jgi:hypothetical protein
MKKPAKQLRLGAVRLLSCVVFSACAGSGTGQTITAYRLSTSNSTTTYSSGISAGAQLSSIVIGADGNLWATEYGRAKISRIVY